MLLKQFLILKSIKNPALWIIIGYCVKGTAVTAAMIYAAIMAV